MASPIREACETFKLTEGMRKVPIDIIWRIYDWLKLIFD
jgi:hypothetical protein